MFLSSYVFTFLLGQHLRVGKALTPPEGLLAAVQPNASPMPTATALAVATITAQMQANDVATYPQATIVCFFFISLIRKVKELYKCLFL